MANTASTDRSPAAAAPGGKARIDLACGCGSACGAPPRAAAPAVSHGDHDHGDGDHGHAHGADSGAAAGHGHDHDHGALPGWGRLGASLVAATGAELLHLLAPDTLPWQ
ncbi:heavy metal translocating P-type ATPase, partial [Paracidovorax cattleyae]